MFSLGICSPFWNQELLSRRHRYRVDAGESHWGKKRDADHQVLLFLRRDIRLSGGRSGIIRCTVVGSVSGVLSISGLSSRSPEIRGGRGWGWAVREADARNKKSHSFLGKGTFLRGGPELSPFLLKSWSTFDSKYLSHTLISEGGGRVT